jgi:ferritin
MLSPDMHNALNQQLNMERENAAIYDALSASLNAVNWDGSARFMKRSADEERTHAQKFSDYLVDMNQTPVYDALPGCPSLEEDDLVVYFQAALQREKMTTAAILMLHRQADEEMDGQTCQFLLWFLEEQTASERELTDCLLELKRSTNDGRILLDQKYGGD